MQTSAVHGMQTLPATAAKICCWDLRARLKKKRFSEYISTVTSDNAYCSIKTHYAPHFPCSIANNCCLPSFVSRFILLLAYRLLLFLFSFLWNSCKIFFEKLDQSWIYNDAWIGAAVRSAGKQEAFLVVRLSRSFIYDPRARCTFNRRRSERQRNAEKIV